MTTGSISLESIPHRAPFLFVDEILDVTDKRIVTRKLADPEAEFFRGHYPGQPVMPGVLICECCFQAGALLVAEILGSYGATEAIPVVTKISDARFRRIVRPGDELRVEVSLEDVMGEAYYLTGRVTVDGANVARVSFVCMNAPTEDTAT